MQQSVVIKRSPIVLIRTFIVIEVAAFALYYLAAALGNYKYEFYLRLPLTALISYQALKFLCLSGAQLIITVYAFLRWYYESYTISSAAISHEYGVFFKKNLTMPLQREMTVVFSSGPLGKIFHYGSITFQSPKGCRFFLRDVQRPERHLDIIKQRLASVHYNSAENLSVAMLFSQSEHEQLEFKSSFRFDHYTKQVNRELEKAAMKTVAAFLNSRGGTLVIGVDDSRKPLGIEYDYQTLSRQSSDGFENHFTNIFNAMIGPEFRRNVRLLFHALDGRSVCVVNVAPADEPAYLAADNAEYFYIRTGNGTTSLKLSEIEAYSRSRWPRGTTPTNISIS